MLLAGCQDKEAELLVPKLYFEASETVIEIDGETTYSVELKSRLTTMVEEDVNVIYTIEGEDVVNAYNYRFGKAYRVLTSAELVSKTAVIKAGQIYSDAIELKLEDLNNLTEGEVYLLPVRVNTGDAQVMDGADIAYYEVKKPVKIMKAAEFSSNYITLPLTPLDVLPRLLTRL